MGVWLHTQRIDHRTGKLFPAKEQQLNKILPGWRQGRPRLGANSKRQTRKTVQLLVMNKPANRPD